MPIYVNGLAAARCRPDDPYFFSQTRKEALKRRRRRAHLRHAARLPPRLRARVAHQPRGQAHPGRPRRRRDRPQPRRRRRHRRRHRHRDGAAHRARRGSTLLEGRGAAVARRDCASARTRSGRRCARRCGRTPCRSTRCARARRSPTSSATTRSSSATAATSSPPPRRSCRPRTAGALARSRSARHARRRSRLRHGGEAGAPQEHVVIVYGDGSFGLHALEFEAMVRQKINVVGVIGNDAGWTQIRRGQVQLYGAERAVPRRSRSRATRRSSRRSAATASTSSGRRRSARRCERALGAGQAGAGEHQDRRQRLPQGRDLDLSAGRGDRTHGGHRRHRQRDPLGEGRRHQLRLPRPRAARAGRRRCGASW